MKYRISYRDMDIWNRYTFQGESKKTISDSYNISATRVSQIIHKVAFCLQRSDYFECNLKLRRSDDFKLRQSDAYGKNVYD